MSNADLSSKAFVGMGMEMNSGYPVWEWSSAFCVWEFKATDGEQGYYYGFRERGSVTR